MLYQLPVKLDSLWEMQTVDLGKPHMKYINAVLDINKQIDS